MVQSGGLPLTGESKLETPAPWVCAGVCVLTLDPGKGRSSKPDNHSLRTSVSTPLTSRLP